MAITDITSQLMRDEGFRSSAYKDSLGFWTIGSGICIDGSKGCGITSQENQMLLSNRLVAIQDEIAKQYPWTAALDPVRLGVLWNIAYEMGVNGLGQFRNMLAKLQVGDYAGASAAALDSAWARTQSPARAQRLAVQLESGIWQ